MFPGESGVQLDFSLNQNRLSSRLRESDDRRFELVPTDSRPALKSQRRRELFTPKPCYSRAMLYLVIKALVSGAIVAAASEVARRWPGIGGLIVSLPLVSLLAFIWLWRDTGDAIRVAQLAQGTFWFFLPSMPLFLLLPAMLRAGVTFWLALGLAIAVTAALYLGMFWLAPKVGIKL